MSKLSIVFFISIFIYSCSTPSGTEDENKLISNRSMAPNFTSTTVSGDSISLSDFKGKVVYLFFLGSFCTVCKANAPGTVTIDNKYSHSEFQLIGLDVWDGSGSQVLDFIGATGAQYPILQKTSYLQNDYGVSYDYSVLVDKEGRVAYKKEGVNPAEIGSNIDALLLE